MSADFKTINLAEKAKAPVQEESEDDSDEDDEKPVVQNKKQEQQQKQQDQEEDDEDEVRSYSDDTGSKFECAFFRV